MVILGGILFFGFSSLAEDAPAGSLATLDPDHLITSDKKSFSAKDSLSFPLSVVVETVSPSSSPVPSLSATPSPTVEAITTVIPEPSLVAEPSVSPSPEVSPIESPGEPPVVTPADTPVSSPVSFWQWLVRPVWAAEAGPIVVDTVTARLRDGAGQELTVVPTVTTEGDHSVVTIPDPAGTLSPGQYALQITAMKDGVTLTTDHSFTWALTPHGIDPTLYSVPAVAEEVPEQRTEQTITFRTSGKQYAAVGNLIPIFTDDGAGMLVPVEPYGVVRDNAVVFDRLPDGVRLNFRLDRPEYTLEKDGSGYTVAMPGGAGKVVDARTLEYPLADGATLRWRVTGNRVEKTITLTKEGIGPTLQFTLTPADGLTAALQDNAIAVRDAQDTVLFTADAPFLTTMDGQRLETNVQLTRTDATHFAYTYREDGLSFPYVLDPSSGPLSPSGAGQPSGTGSWSTIANIAASDNSYTTVTLGPVVTVSQRLHGNSFGFALGSGATITGIVAEFERKSDTTNGIVDSLIQLSKGGSLAGDNKATSTAWSTSDTYDSYGSSSDLWGTTWTTSNINDSDVFRLIITAASS